MVGVVTPRRARVGVGLALVVALVTVLVPGVAAAQAKSYKLFRFDLGFFIPYAHDFGSSGFGMVMEPKFNLHDRFTLGLRFDASVIVGSSVEGATESAGASGQASMQVKAEHFLTTGILRPFVGLATGLYYLASTSMDTGSELSDFQSRAGSYYGLSPQVGLELGFVRFSLFYAALVDARAEAVETTSTGTKPKRWLRNYLGVEIVFRIGGGRRRPFTPPPAASPSRGVPATAPPAPAR